MSEWPSGHLGHTRGIPKLIAWSNIQLLNSPYYCLIDHPLAILLSLYLLDAGPQALCNLLPHLFRLEPLQHTVEELAATRALNHPANDPIPR